MSTTIQSYWISLHLEVIGLYFWAPYWSVDGPMEYIFNAIHTHLLMHFHGIDDLTALGIGLDVIIPQFNGSLKYFLHVGFPDN